MLKTESQTKDPVLKSGVYWLHQTALRPLLPGADEYDLVESCKQIENIGELEFFHFLQEQGLSPLWDKTLLNNDFSSSVSDTLAKSLHQSRLLATASYMLQSHELKDIKLILGNENIDHVIIKGCHTRELIYDEPAIRPSCDIDLLISPHDQVDVIKLLINAGYQFRPARENISHEVSLYKGGMFIDLHWDIMRPGRTRISMVEVLLNTKKEYPTHWGLDNEATLFLMLSHPVFTKYSTTPQSSLVRMVDLAHWIKVKNIDWKKLFGWLEESGLCTAAWITLEWLRQLTQITIPEPLINKIRPGYVKAVYLRYWNKKNYSSKFLKHPLIIQVAYTLPAHDTFPDVVNAIRINLQEKSSATKKTNQLISTLQKNLPE